MSGAGPPAEEGDKPQEGKVAQSQGFCPVGSGVTRAFRPCYWGSVLVPQVPEPRSVVTERARLQCTRSSWPAGAPTRWKGYPSCSHEGTRAMMRAPLSGPCPATFLGLTCLRAPPLWGLGFQHRNFGNMQTCKHHPHKEPAPVTSTVVYGTNCPLPAAYVLCQHKWLLLPC